MANDNIPIPDKLKKEFLIEKIIQIKREKGFAVGAHILIETPKRALKSLKAPDNINKTIEERININELILNYFNRKVIVIIFDIIIYSLSIIS